MSGKDTARKILSQLFNSNPNPQPNIIKVEAIFIEDLTPEVKNKLVKIAYNTYVKKSDLSRVWTIERIDGKDYVVAVDSGRQLSYNYDIKHSDSDIQIVRGDEVLASFPVDELTDVNSLASFLRNKAAMYKFLPSQLFVQAMRNDFESFKKVFISANALMRKSAANDVALSIDTVIPTDDAAINALNYTVDNTIKPYIDSLFLNYSAPGVQNNDELMKEIDSIHKQIINAIKGVINAVKGSSITLEDLSDKIIGNETISSALNEIDQLAQKFNNLDSYPEIIRTYLLLDTYGVSQVTTMLAASLFSLLKERSKTKDVSEETKENRRKQTVEILTERQRLERDITSRGGKVLGYIEGINSYLQILKRLKDEQDNLRYQLNSLIDRLLKYIDIKSDTSNDTSKDTLNDTLKNALKDVIEGLISNPLEITKEQLKEKLRYIFTEYSDDQLNRLVDALSAAFSQAFFKSIKTFFNEVGLRVLSQSVLGKLFYQVIDEGSIPTLESSEIPKDLEKYKQYVADFNALVRSNERFDIVLAKFLERHPEITTKDQIMDIINGISALAQVWTQKAASTLYKKNLAISSSPGIANSLNSDIYEFMNTSHYLEDLFVELIKSLSKEAQNLIYATEKLDLNDEKDLQKIKQYLTDEDRRNFIIAILIIGAMGHVILLQGAAITPHNLVTPSFGGSIVSDIKQAIEQAIAAEKNKPKKDLDIKALKKETIEGAKVKVDYLQSSLLIQLMKINPKFVNERVKNYSGENKVDFINYLREGLQNQLKELMSAHANFKQVTDNSLTLLGDLLQKPDKEKKFLTALPFLARNNAPVTTKIIKKGKDVTKQAINEFATEYFRTLASAYVYYNQENRNKVKEELTKKIEKWQKKYNTTVDAVFGTGVDALVNTPIQVDIAISSVPDLRKQAHYDLIIGKIINGMKDLTRNHTLMGMPNIMMALSHQTGFVASIFAKYIGPESITANIENSQLQIVTPENNINLGTPTSPYSSGKRKNPIILSRKLYKINGFPDYFIRNFLLSDPQLKELYDVLSDDVRYFTGAIKYNSTKFKSEWDLIAAHVTRLVTPDNLNKAYNDFLKDLKRYLPPPPPPSTTSTTTPASQASQAPNNTTNTLEDVQNMISNKTYTKIEREAEDFKDKLNAPDGQMVLDDLIIAFTRALHLEILTNQPEMNKGILTLKAYLAKLLKQSSSSDNLPSLAGALNSLSYLLDLAYSCASLWHPMIKTAAKKKKNIGPVNPAPTNPAPTNPAPTNPAPTNPAPTNPAPTNQINPYLSTIQAFEEANKTINERMRRVWNTVYEVSQEIITMSNGVNLWGRHSGKLPAMLFDYIPTLLNHTIGFLDSQLESGVPQLKASSQRKLHTYLQDVIRYGNSYKGLKAYLKKFLKPACDNVEKGYTKKINDITNKLTDIAASINKITADLKNTQNKDQIAEYEKQINEYNEQKKGLEEARKNIEAKRNKIESLKRYINEVLQSTYSNEYELASKITEIRSQFNYISVFGGMPVEIEMYNLEPDSYFSPLIPSTDDEATLKKLRLVEKMLGIDSQLIDGLSNTLGTITQIRLTLELAGEKIQVLGEPMSDADLVRFSQLFPLSPTARLRAHMHSTSGIYVLSDGLINFLYQELPKADYKDFVDMVDKKINGTINTVSIDDRIKLLSKILKLILRYDIDFYQHDISTLFYLLEIHPRLGRDIVKNIKDMFEDVAKTLTEQSNPGSNSLVNYYINILERYFSGTPNNNTIAQYLFRFLNTTMMGYISEKFGQQAQSKLKNRIFEDYWDTALKKLKIALNNPKGYSSKVAPYLIRTEDIEANELDMKGKFTKDDLDYIFSILEQLYNEKASNVTSGKVGTVGSKLSELLYSGQYSRILGAAVDGLTQIVLPWIMRGLDENDVITNFPPDMREDVPYKRPYNSYLLKEYLSGFIIKLFGILIDSYIALNGQTYTGNIDSKIQQLSNDLRKKLNGPVNSRLDEACKYIVDIIGKVLKDKMGILQILNVTQTTERTPMIFSKGSFFNYKDTFNYSLIKIGEIAEAIQNIDPDVKDPDIKDLEAKAKALVALLVNQVQNISRLLDKAKQVNKELEEEINKEEELNKSESDLQ